MPTNPAAGCGPAPAAAWDRKVWSGALIATAAPLAPSLVGVTEHAVFASAISVIVDTSQAIIPAGVSYFVAVYATTLNGGKQYQAQFSDTGGESPVPTGHIIAGYVTSNAIVTPSGLIVRASGVGVSLWGVEMACIGVSGGERLQGLWVSSIAHGRERL